MLRVLKQQEPMLRVQWFLAMFQAELAADLTMAFGAFILQDQRHVYGHLYSDTCNPDRYGPTVASLRLLVVLGAFLVRAGISSISFVGRGQGDKNTEEAVSHWLRARKVWLAGCFCNLYSGLVLLSLLTVQPISTGDCASL